MGSVLPYIIKPFTTATQSKNRGYSCAVSQHSAEMPQPQPACPACSQRQQSQKSGALHDLIYLVSPAEGHATIAGDSANRLKAVRNLYCIQKIQEYMTERGT